MLIVTQPLLKCYAKIFDNVQSVRYHREAVGGNRAFDRTAWTQSLSSWRSLLLFNTVETSNLLETRAFGRCTYKQTSYTVCMPKATFISITVSPSGETAINNFDHLVSTEILFYGVFRLCKTKRRGPGVWDGSPQVPQWGPGANPRYGDLRTCWRLFVNDYLKCDVLEEKKLVKRQKIPS